jgi:purine-cytosine permease-like protein
MLKAGLSIAALVIVVFSTVTTTFLDAFSAGVSSETISKKINGKIAAIVVTVIGTAAAMIWPMDNITNFLYLIGSVFAPMIAVQAADYFILRRDSSGRDYDWANLAIWLAGFVIYRLLMSFVNTPVGYTAIDMVLTAALCVGCRRLIPAKTAA